MPPARTRQTPVQAAAKKLPSNHTLSKLIDERFRVSLDEEPEVLLRQLDDLPNWPALVKYPAFEDNYPPEMPDIDDPDLLSTAYTTGNNAVLEWFGDALIWVAVVSCAWHLGVDCNDRGNNNTITYLCSKPFLAHLALLYGVQLHDYCHDRRWVGMPGMERTCDIFESLAGAAASDVKVDEDDSSRGLMTTLDWLEDLFEPWVAGLCTPTKPGRPRISSRIRRQYEFCVRSYADSPIAYMSPPNFATQSSGHVHLGPDEHKAWIAQILGPRRDWRDLDASRIDFRPGYPEALPSLNGADTEMLTTVFTDCLYRVHLGGNTTSNEQYRTLGTHICKLAVTTLAIAQLPTAAPALLHDVRLECTDPDLLARLALLMEMNHHLRVLRPVGQDAKDITPRESTDVFYAVVVVVYLEWGWRELLKWLGDLFNPWILAAGDGRFRCSAAAQKSRESRQIPKLSSSESPRRQSSIYASVVPRRKPRKPRDVRARVPGRIDRDRVKTASFD